MAPTFASAWRSFWHTMTSNDRHAYPDSPYRTGVHVPLDSNRHPPLTSVTADSTVDLSSPYEDADSTNGFTPTTAQPMSPSIPYSPGSRSAFTRQRTDDTNAGEIQMSNFRDGLPPPPPPSHTWKRIDRWMEDNYEELFENLGAGCTQNDLNELETQLDCSLPMDVRESLMIHDGQERGGQPTGVVFGCMLLDCEEIVQEWTNWRIVDQEYLAKSPDSSAFPQVPSKAFGASSSSAPPPDPQPNSHWRQELQSKQDSQPPNAVQKQYSHPAWIPMARDWGGNNICVDLAPGPAGQWGQVILMGRDFDCKYVVGRSWAAFLATLADDMSTDKWYIEEESKELKLREFNDAEPNYIDILRWRCDQKYGRKPPAGKRKMPSLQINSSIAEARTNGATSPYSSPVLPEVDRGRSPQRFSLHNKTGGASSPLVHVFSPLGKVAEETAGKNQGALKKNKENAITGNLVSLDSPRFSAEGTGKAFGAQGTASFEQEQDHTSTNTDVQSARMALPANTEASAAMTNVEI